MVVLQSFIYGLLSQKFETKIMTSFEVVLPFFKLQLLVLSDHLKDEAKIVHNESFL
jgi:hypothetical protein